MTSLGRAIVTRIFGALLVVGIVFVGASYIAARYETNEFMDDLLRQFSSVVGPDTPMPENNALREPEDRFERIVWKGHSQVSASPGAPRLMSPPTTLGFADLHGRGENWRTFSSAREGFVVMLAQKSRAREEMATHAAVEIALVVLATMLIVWAIVGLSVRITMRSFAAFGIGIAQRSLDATNALEAEGLPREILPVVEAMNVLIARLQAALAQQRRFVADSAHELRTPLAALAIQIDNLASSGMPETGPVSSLRHGIARASSVCDQLLSLARFDSLRRPRDLEIVDLSALVTQCCADLVELGEHAGIDLGIGGTERCRVRGARADLVTLFDNVIENAIRYTPAGGSVDCAVVQTTGGTVVSIVDTGPGVSAESLPRLTERFFRGATLDTTGSGLGLSIVKAIADAHDLGLKIDNRSDRSGLRVTVTFPATVCETSEGTFIAT